MAVTRVIKTTFTGGEMSPALGARVDLDRYRTGLKTALNVFIHPHGGVSNRAGFEYRADIVQDALTVMIRFVADVDTDEVYMLLLSPGRIEFTRRGFPILEAPDTPQGLSDDLFTQTAHGLATGDRATVVTGKLQGLDVVVETVGVDAFRLRRSNGSTVTAESAGGTPQYALWYRVDVPYAESDLRAVSVAQDNDVLYMVHPDHPAGKLKRMGDTDWVYEAVDFSPNANYPTTVTAQATLPPDYTRTTDGATEQVGLPTLYRYIVSSIDAETGEESLPSVAVAEATNDLALQGGKNRVSWSAVAGAERYVVYKNVEGSYGYIGTTEELYMDDANIIEDTTDGPQQGVNPFEGVGNYPSTVTLHDQRLVFASTGADPQAVYLSKATLLENFDVASPAKADDAITFRLRWKSRQRIRSMLSVTSGLALFTSTTEWLVSGGNDEGYLTPTNPHPLPQTHRGSYFLPPLPVGDVALYAQARGSVVREFAYSVLDNAFRGPDRTIMARHLFKNRRIVSWCYAQAPYSIVWVVLDSGQLLAMTYEREHEVWGWTRMDVGGFVEDVETLPEGGEDAVYINVRRTRADGEARFHERLASRAVETIADWFFADSGLRYSGSPVSQVTGLHHLDGETVSILADGNVLPEAEVQEGTVQLGHAYTNVVVGLAYHAEIETLDLDVGALPELGTVSGRYKTAPELVVRVEDTRGFWYGVTRDTMDEWKQRSTEDYGEATRAFTGPVPQLTPQADWTLEGNFVVQQRDPLPLTILSIAPDIEIGG